MDCGEQDEVSMSETISELSQYSEWQDSQESPGRKRKAALNDFLAAVDISPIKRLLLLTLTWLQRGRNTITSKRQSRSCILC